jgi:hypothetical protein
VPGKTGDVIVVLVCQFTRVAIEHGDVGAISSDSSADLTEPDVRAVECGVDGVGEHVGHGLIIPYP